MSIRRLRPEAPISETAGGQKLGLQAPDRWVIDFSRNDAVIRAPQNYYRIPNPEDRLLLAAEYVRPQLRGCRQEPA
ncbi:hypothetical protein BH20ACT24_BH20ACT24_13560 [soil metagenome]